MRLEEQLNKVDLTSAYKENDHDRENMDEIRDMFFAILQKPVGFWKKLDNNGKRALVKILAWKSIPFGNEKTNLRLVNSWDCEPRRSVEHWSWYFCVNQFHRNQVVLRQLPNIDSKPATLAELMNWIAQRTRDRYFGLAIERQVSLKDLIQKHGCEYFGPTFNRAWANGVPEQKTATALYRLFCFSYSRPTEQRDLQQYLHKKVYPKYAEESDSERDHSPVRN